MRKDKILIKKDLIPYKFSILLNNTSFSLEIRYNAECELFVIGLYDKEDNLLCYEPIIYGAELFKQQYQSGVYPAMRIVPLDDSNENKVVTWDNLSETVFLIIDNAG